MISSVKKISLHAHERSRNMNEKNLYISHLYDYYGELLTDKQKYAIELYYNDDLSLSEIAATIGITRQGVRDQIKHAEEFLCSCEQKLGFASKLAKALALAEQIRTETTQNEIIEKASSIAELLS